MAIPIKLFWDSIIGKDEEKLKLYEKFAQDNNRKLKELIEK